MKKIIFCALFAIVSMHATAQQSNDELSSSYTMIGAGYTSETSLGNGAYLNLVTSRKLYEGLCIDIGVMARYTSFSAGYSSSNNLDATVMVGPSYQYNFNSKVALIPFTGANLGGRFSLDGNGKNFIFGWDTGLKFRYKKVAIIYAATIGISNRLTSHSIGLAYGF